MNCSSSQARVSIRRPRSSGITLRVLVRTSLIMRKCLSRGGIISGVRPSRPARPRAAEQSDHPFRPAAETVQTPALRDRFARAGEEPAAQLGNGAKVGAAHLAKEDAGQSSRTFPRDEGVL